jgi:hypothetical protein
VGDFNGDGHDDLAVTDLGAGTVSVFNGLGNGTFARKIDYPTAPGPFGGAVGDFNEDGAADLVTADSAANKASVLLNTHGHCH